MADRCRHGGKAAAEDGVGGRIDGRGRPRGSERVLVDICQRVPGPYAGGNKKLPMPAFLFFLFFFVPFSIGIPRSTAIAKLAAFDCSLVNLLSR